MGWVRVGECPPERCQGRCCTHIGTWFNDSPEARAFLETLKVRGVEVQTHIADGTAKHLVKFPQTCQWLTDSGLCSLHPAMRPEADKPPRPDFCEVWPQEPSQLVNDPYCGFRFVWQYDEQEQQEH